MDLRVKAQQYILCSQYFVLGKRRRLKICPILGLNLINLRGTVPSTPSYSHALFRAWEYSLLISILRPLPHILAPYCSPYPLYSLVSSLYSHISLCPSTYTLHSLASSFYSHISPYPSTYTLYSLVSSLFSHISQYTSTYTLYSLVSSLFSHISPHRSTYPLYSLVSSLFSHISPYPSTYTLYSLVSSLYFHIFPCPLHMPSTLLYCPCTLIAELHAREAPELSKSTHPRKFGNHVTVHRSPLTVRPHHRKTNVLSHTFYYTHIAHQCCCC